MKAFTDITVLLDRSGSMQSIKGAMETAFRLFLQEHKAIPSTKLTLIMFDDVHDQEVVYRAVPIRQAEKMVIRPRGNTPLLDAFCKAIDSTGRRLSRMKESERPDQVLFIVITDGQENASKEFTRSDVFERVTRQRDNYGWQFIYLGANQDSFAEAASFGIAPQWALNYRPSQSGVVGMAKGMAANTFNYAANVGGARGQHVNSFTTQQRKEAEAKEDDGA